MQEVLANVTFSEPFCIIFVLLSKLLNRQYYSINLRNFDFSFQFLLRVFLTTVIYNVNNISYSFHDH